MALTADDLQWTSYNGQQVRTGDSYKAQLADGAAAYNKSAGTTLDAEGYDRMLNGDTANARWGSTAGAIEPYKPTPTPAPSTGGGLLNPTPTPAPAAAPAPVVSYDPTKQVMSDTSSVQNQIANITGTDSKLNTLAAAEADKQSNRRGLLNSSIAVGAAQKAVLQSALPIAQQDASTSASTDAANANFANSASQFNANAQNTAALQTQLANIQANTTLSVTDKNNNTNLTIAGNDNATKTLLAQMDASSKLSLAGIDANTKMALANLDATTKTNLQTLQQNNQQLLQTNVSASNIFTQYMTNLANISTSDKLDGPAKQQAADNQLNALNAQLQALGQISGLDLSKYFQNANPPATT